MVRPPECRATFVGIGAQKTASTWLHGVLASFPQVVTSTPKELDFFSAAFDRGYEWYERHFASPRPARHRGEVSPSYLVDADAPARAAAYNGDLLILLTLRDPVERAFSNHLHEVRAGHVSGDNLAFGSALANNPLYLEQGYYARYLRRWLDHFPRENVFVLFQEAIAADGAGEVARLAGALGLAAPVALAARRPNESTLYRNRTLGRALWCLGERARRNGLGGAVERVKGLPGIAALQAANRLALRDQVAPMTGAMEARLVDVYAADVADLAGLLGAAPPWPRFA